jgi:predicted nuclease with TOPRIM domain
VQALPRKRSEEDSREAYGNLQIKFKELQAQSEELHKTNEMLLESERHFHKMTNTIPQLAWIAHPDSYIY